ncbi:hypothetical protein [Viridibacillus arvi]|uniref:hypothetical protein n=1 Tax=Viridibacillus arvi TaxID=263475 RepID=UPI0034CF865B
MDFKEALKADLAAFVNPDEFGDEHVFDGVSMMMVVAEDENDETKLSTKYQLFMEDVFAKNKRLHFFDGLVPFPEVGNKVEFDGDYYYVISSSLNEGLVRVEITAHVT